MDWSELASEESIAKTVAALNANGINTIVVQTGEEAKNKVLEMIPKGAEVSTASSTTMIQIGLMKELNESGNYNSIRAKLMDMDRNAQKREMVKTAAAPEWMLGSVHAVTEDGKVLTASASGSQLPGYAYTAEHVIWLVSTQKIVKDFDQAVKRIYEHVLPLESQRAMGVYGFSSNVSKLLMIAKESVPNRITMILIKEKLGF